MPSTVAPNARSRQMLRRSGRSVPVAAGPRRASTTRGSARSARAWGSTPAQAHRVETRSGWRRFVDNSTFVCDRSRWRRLAHSGGPGCSTLRGHPAHGKEQVRRHAGVGERQLVQTWAEQEHLDDRHRVKHSSSSNSSQSASSTDERCTVCDRAATTSSPSPSPSRDLLLLVAVAAVVCGVAREGVEATTRDGWGRAEPPTDSAAGSVARHR